MTDSSNSPIRPPQNDVEQWIVIDKQERIIAAQQERILQLEAAYRKASDSYEEVIHAKTWKMTLPLRFLMDAAKCVLHRQAPGYSLAKAYPIRTSLRVRHIARKELFSASELKRQSKEHFDRKIKFSIVTPLFNTPERFLRDMIQSVQAQTYADWELCLADGSDGEHGQVEAVCRAYAKRDSRIRYRKLPRNLGISGNTNACLDMAEGDYIGLMDHDDMLHPAALYEVARTICQTGADFVYTDEALFKKTPRDAYTFYFKPVYAPDTLMANNYICHFAVFSRSLQQEAGAFDPACDGSQDYDMVLRLTERAACVAHIPEILYYWRAHEGSVAERIGVKPYMIGAGIKAVSKRLQRLGREGEAAPVRPGLPIYRVRYAIKGTPKVSILIPNSGHLYELNRCLDSIFNKTTWPDYEVVIVENNSQSPEVFAYYDRLQKERANVRVVTWNGPFNYSAVNNFGARHCRGAYLLLLNNDTEVITPDWIEEMLMFAQRGDVGAVGAKLYYPDGTVQHAGIGLGLGGIAGHYFYGADRQNLGYYGRLIYAQNMSAVTAACMLMRRSVWDQVGGLDEKWPAAFGDVDLCLRIRKAGYLIVWTPFAELYHDESKSRGKDDDPEKQARFQMEISRFRERWGQALAEGDPYFNPNFDSNRSDFFPQRTLTRQKARCVWKKEE